MTEEPLPIAYTALQAGTPMLSTSGAQFGTVDVVLEIPEHDLFDGIIVTTSTGRRFVDADQVVEVTTAYVRCTVSDEEAAQLPEPSTGCSGEPGGAETVRKTFRLSAAGALRVQTRRDRRRCAMAIERAETHRIPHALGSYSPRWVIH